MKEGLTMRKYKQVKEKKITYSLDEWAIIEERAALAMMRTGTFIRNISLNGQVNIYSVSDISQLMNALRIIGNNINQIAKKANETHSLYQEDVDKLRSEVETLCQSLSRLTFTQRSNAA